jgi:hypothetical protein
MICESTSFTKHISSDLDVLTVIVLNASWTSIMHFGKVGCLFLRCLYNIQMLSEILWTVVYYTWVQQWSLHTTCLRFVSFEISRSAMYFVRWLYIHYRHSTQNAQLMERSRSMHTTTNNFMQLIPQYLFS